LEPAGFSDADWAAALGAAWEGAELVTYDLPALRRGFEEWGTSTLKTRIEARVSVGEYISNH